MQYYCVGPAVQYCCAAPVLQYVIIVKSMSGSMGQRLSGTYTLGRADEPNMNMLLHYLAGSPIAHSAASYSVAALAHDFSSL